MVGGTARGRSTRVFRRFTSRSSRVRCATAGVAGDGCASFRRQPRTGWAWRRVPRHRSAGDWRADLRAAAGRQLGLQRSVWPSYWGHADQRPLLPAVVQKIADKLLPKTTVQPVGTDREQIKAVPTLRGEGRGGRALVRAERHAPAQRGRRSARDGADQPCMWSLAHNVRRRRSRSAFACTDCHAADLRVLRMLTTARPIARRCVRAHGTLPRL